MRQFVTALKHRQIYKFGLIYLAVAWVLIQIAVNVEGPLRLPTWLDTLVITLLALGLPLVLILAWLREPSGGRNAIGTTYDSAEASAPGAAERAGFVRGADNAGAVPGAAPGVAPATPAGAPGSVAADVAPVRGEIRFCTTPDGYRLAHSRIGAGAIPVLRTGNWVSHLEAEWSSPMHQPFLRDLSREFELIIYDGRGTGVSDRHVTAFSLDTMVEDMETVANANALEQFAIVAYSQSCAVAVAYAVRHPERVSRMVLYGGFLHNFRAQEEIDAMATLFTQTWGQIHPATRQLFTTVLFPDATKEECEGFNELLREAVSPETAARLFRACHAIDVRELAAKVTVPTLVIHSRYEPGVPLECGREMAALIPGARFVILDSRNHLVLEREPAYRQFIDETISFIRSA